MSASGGEGCRAIVPLQPVPIQALVASFETDEGAVYTTVVRRWAASAAARCRLCRRCTAVIGPDRQAMCIVAVEGEVSEASAALFSPDGLG